MGEALEMTLSQEVDCSSTGCPAKCDCAFSRCQAPMAACLADEACGSQQVCVSKCLCGDSKCLVACNEANPAPELANPLLQCVLEECAACGAADAMFLEAMEMTRAQKVDCSSTGCPAKCDCAFSRCQVPLAACLADEACGSQQACVSKCPCGDSKCLVACNEANTAPELANPLLQCVLEECAASGAADAMLLEAMEMTPAQKVD